MTAAARIDLSRVTPWAGPIADRFFLLPVVAHNGASSDVVRDAIALVSPNRIALQLPIDAQPQVEFLSQTTKLPVALYGFEPGHPEHRVFVPLSATSPQITAATSRVPMVCVDTPIEDRLTGRLDRDRFIAERLREIPGQQPVLALIDPHRLRAVAAALAEDAITAKVPASKWTVWLVPYDERRMHEGGHCLFPRWARRTHGHEATSEAGRVIAAVGRASRASAEGSPCSVDDEIEALRATVQLGQLRGRFGPGVREVLDGVRLAMVDASGPTLFDARDTDLSTQGPFGALGPHLARQCIGRARGELPEGVGVVPLLADVRQRRDELGLSDNRELRLDVFRSPLDQKRSHCLHQLALLGLPGARLIRDVMDDAGDVQFLFERWRARWGAKDDEVLIEAAPLGPTLIEACEAQLRRTLRQPQVDLVAAARALELALRANLQGAVVDIAALMTDGLAPRADFEQLGAALTHVLVTAESVAASEVDPRLEGLARRLADRAIAALGRPGPDPTIEIADTWVMGMQTLFLWVRRRPEHAGGLAMALRRASGRGPLLRGASEVLLRELGAGDVAVLEALASECAAARRSGERLSAFLTGALLAGKGLLTRSPEVLQSLDDVIAGWHQREFWRQLPDLRLAFTGLSAPDLLRLSHELAGRSEDSVLDGSSLGADFDAELVARLNALDVTTPTRGDPIEAASPSAVSTRAPARWRLILGDRRTEWPERVGLDAADQRRNSLLDFLYEREPVAPGESADHVAAGQVLDWLAQSREHFSEETVERMQEHALHRYGLQAMLLDATVLAQMQPTAGLARALIALRDHLTPEVIDQVRKIIRRVVAEIRKHFENRLRASLQGVGRRPERSPLRIARNLDLPRTIRDNLKNYDTDENRLGIERLVFTTRVRRRNAWRLLLLVDQSGSMLDAAVDAAILAGIFAGLPMLDTRLIAFNVEPVDLTAHIHDTAELLLRRIPAGGTHIDAALRYAEELVSVPAQTLVVVVTDLYEGGPADALLNTFARLKSAGVRQLVLTAIGKAPATHDPQMAQRLLEMDIPVAALEPEALGEWIGKQIR